jgi:hypothetical protein
MALLQLKAALPGYILTRRCGRQFWDVWAGFGHGGLGRQAVNNQGESPQASGRIIRATGPSALFPAREPRPKPRARQTMPTIREVVGLIGIYDYFSNRLMRSMRSET